MNQKHDFGSVITASGRAGFALCVLALSGCGSKSATVPVHGQVTLDGKPLDGEASITFAPAASFNQGHIAQAAIKADGSYSLSSFAASDGAMPGPYTVSIRGTPPPPPIDDYSKAPTGPASAKVPAIYGDWDKTPLKATVPDSGSAEINFELKSSK